MGEKIKLMVIFCRLIAFELIIVGGVSAVVNYNQGYDAALVISLISILAGGIIFALAHILQKRPIIRKIFETFISRYYRRYVLFATVILLSLFFVVFEPSEKITIMLGHLLFWTWLVGLEAIWFFQPVWNGISLPLKHSQRKRLSVFAILLVYGFLLIPSRIPSLLTGIPLNQPVEFVIAVFIIPLAFIINWYFFADWNVVVVLISLIIIKLLISLFMPQHGLGVRIFRIPNSLKEAVWEKSYNSRLSPLYTDVMNAPYSSMRELPVEWVNDYFGFDFDQFWMTLELDGMIHIPDDGRFVLVTRGASEVELEIIDLASHTKMKAMVVNDIKDLEESLYNQLPEFKNFNLHAIILYKNFGEARLEPVILYPDGSIKSVFETLGAWLPGENTLSQNQIIFFRFILDGLNLILVGIISFGFLAGLAELLNRNQLSIVDMYLTLTSIIVYYAARFIPKPQLPFFLIGLLVFVIVIKMVDHKLVPLETSFTSYIVSVGIIFLSTVMILDIDSLRAMTPLPVGQDGLEYQTFARYIYVYGDPFLFQTPPRAYKVLFPYLVGALHLFFGQSMSAQFFLNSWCAILTSVLTFQLARFLKLPSKFAFPVSTLLLLILCFPASFTFYYRFGLIEPIAILCLFTTLYFAATKKLVWMFITGILTVLFRLDYIGLTSAALLLTAPVMMGTVRQTWMQLLDWIVEKWKLITVYLISLCAAPLSVIYGYFLLTPNYMLNAYDTKQNSLQTVFESLVRVTFGDTPVRLFFRFIESPLDILLITIPLVCGFFIAMAAILFRKGVFSKLDMRWALLIPSFLLPYVAVQPTGYFPRFSFSLLPLDLIMIGLLVYFFISNTSQDETS